MNLKKIVPVLWVVLIAFPVAAQKGKNLANAVDAALSRQTAKQVLPKQLPSYHPVFGYTQFKGVSAWTATPFKVPVNWHEIQVAPLLTQDGTKRNYSQETSFISEYDLRSPTHVAQAVYLWRLANPDKSLRKQHEKLFEQAYDLVKKVQDSKELRKIVEDYPAVKFLTWLLKDDFKPQSYAELVATVAEYPKHVTLNQVGFPVSTAQADLSSWLDTQLMLSSQQEMQVWNNLEDLQAYMGFGRDARVFVLTPEEQQAAARLALLRQQAYQIPAHPTSRQLIEQAYNELESQVLSYAATPRVFDNLYRVYPFYENTALSGAIAHKLDELKSVGLMPEDAEYINYVHLLVLNTMMRGSVVQKNAFGYKPSYLHRVFNYEEVNTVVWAFKELCNMVPNNKANIEHLYRLQQGLRSALGSWTYPDMPFLQWEFEERMPDISAEKIAELRYWAHRLFETEDVRNLVGKNLK